MTIEWKDPNLELPQDGECVAALRYHWKQCWPLSVEIMFGEVESYQHVDGYRVARVNTCDFTGGGNYHWNFPVNKYFDSDHIAAWAYSKEFKRPEFLIHNTHWGKEK